MYYLKTKWKIFFGENFSEEIIDYSRGSIKKALLLCDESYIEIAKDIQKCLLSKNFLSINKKFEEIKSDKNLKPNIKNILDMVMLICYKNIKNDIKTNTYLIDVLNETNKNVERNGNIDLVLDNMIVQICFN